MTQEPYVTVQSSATAQNDSGLGLSVEFVRNSLWAKGKPWQAVYLGHSRLTDPLPKFIRFKNNADLKK